MTNWQDELRESFTRMALEIERTRTELSTGLGEFHNGMRLRAARYQPVGDGGRSLAYAGTGRLVGWSLRAAGGPVSVTLRDARDESGDTLAVLELTDGASDTVWLGPGGVSFGEGLYVGTTGDGSLQGAVWIGAVD